MTDTIVNDAYEQDDGELWIEVEFDGTQYEGFLPPILVPEEVEE